MTTATSPFWIHVPTFSHSLVVVEDEEPIVAGTFLGGVGEGIVEHVGRDAAAFEEGEGGFSGETVAVEEGVGVPVVAELVRFGGWGGDEDGWFDIDIFDHGVWCCISISVRWRGRWWG